jgi:hypothetical protein
MLSNYIRMNRNQIWFFEPDLILQLESKSDLILEPKPEFLGKILSFGGRGNGLEWGINTQLNVDFGPSYTQNWIWFPEPVFFFQELDQNQTRVPCVFCGTGTIVNVFKELELEVLHTRQELFQNIRRLELVTQNNQ